MLANIRENLRQLAEQVTERLQTFALETGQPLTLANFVRYHDYDPETLLSKDTWTGWRVRARLIAEPKDPDRLKLQAGLVRTAQANGPTELRVLRAVATRLQQRDVNGAVEVADQTAVGVHYRLWGQPAKSLGFATLQEYFDNLAHNPGFLSNLIEVIDWAEGDKSRRPTGGIAFPLLS